jgi:hypothetical protein
MNISSIIHEHDVEIKYLLKNLRNNIPSIPFESITINDVEFIDDDIGTPCFYVKSTIQEGDETLSLNQLLSKVLIVPSRLAATGSKGFKNYAGVYAGKNKVSLNGICIIRIVDDTAPTEVNMVCLTEVGTFWVANGSETTTTIEGRCISNPILIPGTTNNYYCLAFMNN